MNIGILTFHRPNNYGAVFQAFAIQKAIQMLNVNCEIVDYRNYIIENLYHNKTFSTTNGILEKFKFLLRFYNGKRNNEQFENFRNIYMKLSSPIYNHGLLKNAFEQYDKIIVGSDQVWNPDAHDFDKAYFLEQISNRHKKNSYAASFGKNGLDNKLKSEYRNLLKDFENISVREPEGYKIVEELGLHAVINIDPTFLIRREKWKELFNNISDRKPYILVYTFENTFPILNSAKKLHIETGMPIYTITPKPIRNREAAHFKSLYPCSPEDFIKAIGEASYVVTNSFHGLAFSIIFNTPFFACMLEYNTKVNCRIENLLNNVFKLNGRIVNELTQVPINSQVNWDEVNAQIDAERERGLGYLSGIIGGKHDI